MSPISLLARARERCSVRVGYLIGASRLLWPFVFVLGAKEVAKRQHVTQFPFLADSLKLK